MYSSPAIYHLGLYCSYVFVNGRQYVEATVSNEIASFSRRPKLNIAHHVCTFAYKPGVPFVAHRQTVIAPDLTPQNAASHLGLFCLHREISSKNDIKIKITPNTPENEIGLIQLITMGKSIRQMWVNHM